ncbi:MAG TPA: 4Fe-4S dicluster domain-containing protein [Syntrophomonadaceae bacterium]|nr:4Fe-4S dicluster domain-containing protein [Syntrophomonadaceae bacterium]
MSNMTNLYDSSKCTACRGCQVACKNWNQLPAVIEPFKGSYQTKETTDGDTYTIVKMNEYEDPVAGIQWKFAKFQCMHCLDPACMKVCPRGAYSKTETGATNHDPDKCIGCQYCSYACPFEVPKYRKREDKVAKCTLCSDRTAAGLKPACVTTCAPGALTYGNRDELLAQARERVKYLQANGYPKATVYGATELGGLNKLYILTDTPDKFGLPVDPKAFTSVNVWQNWVQPYFGWLIPLALAGSAVSFVTTRILANKNGEHSEHGEGGHE